LTSALSAQLECPIASSNEDAHQYIGREPPRCSLCRRQTCCRGTGKRPRQRRQAVMNLSVHPLEDQCKRGRYSWPAQPPSAILELLSRSRDNFWPAGHQDDRFVHLPRAHLYFYFIHLLNLSLSGFVAAAIDRSNNHMSNRLIDWLMD